MNQIPRTELYVSPVCLGTMNFGTPVGEKAAIELIRYALDRGVNFIDTANMYEGYARYAGSHGGIAEQYIGKAMAGCRDKFVLATKFGMKVGPAPEDEGCGPAALKKQLDRSLNYLKTDYIDIYYAHKYDPAVPPEELAGAMREAMEQGKIRHYAVSNYDGNQLSTLLEAVDRWHLPRPVLCQPPLSLLKQDALQDVVAVCARESVGVVPYQALQGGLLTGKYKRTDKAPAGSRAAESSWVWERDDALFAKLEAFEREAALKGMTLTQYALSWAASRPAVCSVLVGIKSTGQIDDAIAAMDKEF